MLKISHLQKHYRGFSLDCSMEVQPGMITGLIGRNGSGKSTTFKALLGLIHPDGGEIEVFGKKAEELKPEDKQKLGSCFCRFRLQYVSDSSGRGQYYEKHISGF